MLRQSSSADGSGRLSLPCKTSVDDMPKSAAIDTVTEGLSFLKTNGFTLLRAEESTSEAIGRILTVEYVSATTSRSVVLTYFSDLPRASASIRRTDGDFAFADAGSMAVREPSFAKTPGNGLDKLTNYLRELRGELSRRYLPILMGETFANDAFDWSPYK